ncbi:MAG TPA: methyltransferase [Rhodopila sp.]|nr:methyltransferase [Rhodopila sp.]
MTSLSDRWFAVRNRLLASPAFQRWAASFPLTRPVARRRAQAAFDLCAGFVYSQILQACVDLKLFDAVRTGPRRTEDLAAELFLSPDAMARLLEAAAALRLIEQRGKGRFGLGVLGAAFVGNPGATAMIRHHPLLYADLRDPVALLRDDRQQTALGRLWPYAAAGADGIGAADVADYSNLMAASQPLVAEDILDAYRLDRHRCLLDIGGGDGTFIIRAGTRHPHLKLMVFDLPPVAERAQQHLIEAGLHNRAQAYGGDVRAGDLPQGADIVSLVRVIHDHDDSEAMRILRAAWKALPPSGTLLLAEPMAGTSAAPGVEAYFVFYLLAMGSGRPRTADELTHMLRTAGFTDVRALASRRPMLVRILVATRDEGSHEA